jgi:hypothetical protein
MKTKALRKKLMLTKETIAHLKTDLMVNIKAGQAADTYDDCTLGGWCTSPGQCETVECPHETWGNTCDTWCP